MGFEEVPKPNKWETIVNKWRGIKEGLDKGKELWAQSEANELDKKYEELKEKVAGEYAEQVLNIIGWGSKPADYGPEDDKMLNEVLDEETKALEEVRTFEREKLGMSADSEWLRHELETIEMTRP